MNDLTEGFRLFRDLARIVWNCGLRLYPDGEHEFFFAEQALFTAMVVSQAAQELAKIDVNGIRYYPQIKVLPTPQQRMTALVGYKQPDFVEWKVEELLPDTDLRFGKVFDFDTLDGSYRDFRYVFCADVRDPEDVRRVLIDAHDVTLSEVIDKIHEAG